MRAQHWKRALLALTLSGLGAPALAQTQDTTIAFVYDAMGNIKAVTRPLGRVSSFQYDLHTSWCWSRSRPRRAA
jgi:YD repeat-containing protein